jgi:predicted NBD/HSP70 family sugar kinase
MRVGACAGRRGTVLIATLGTGFGSALFHDGHLVPNLELGHLKIRGRAAETRPVRLRRSGAGFHGMFGPRISTNTFERFTGSWLPNS